MDSLPRFQTTTPLTWTRLHGLTKTTKGIVSPDQTISFLFLNSTKALVPMQKSSKDNIVNQMINRSDVKSLAKATLSMPKLLTSASPPPISHGGE
jgi:hypothetical protein